MNITELIQDKERFFHQIKEDWLAADDTFPVFLPEVSREDKQLNEGYLKTVTNRLQKQMKKYHKVPIGRSNWKKQTLEYLNDILYNEEILFIHQYLTRDEIDVFVTELKEFMRNARAFAPELSLADLGQAIRNYIVYAMFKKMHGNDSGFHPAAFGYSMLYPFTDNYIDNGLLTATEKEEYNRMIRDKLLGSKVYPRSVHEQKTCQLLDYIEEVYKRDQKPQVFTLLLMMLEAQEISIHQQNSTLPLSFEERLDISIYKGGISVLMDRFFVDREISSADMTFYLSFGFFLQLADDLQDIGEDSSLGHSNLFTMELLSKSEEKTVNKLFHYVHSIMEVYPAENEQLKKFLMMNSYQLIYSSVLRSKGFFSSEYLLALEKYFPVTFAYWENLSDGRLEIMDLKSQNKYINFLDELIR